MQLWTGVAGADSIFRSGKFRQTISGRTTGEAMAKIRRTSFLACVWMLVTALQLPAQQKKPNILVIFGDDIDTWNVGAYTHGMMGRTPNIDSIAATGMLFTDYYGQPSCTAGRAAFIMGQLPVRTGMTTVGIPSSARGVQKEDPTLAEVTTS